MLWLTARKKRQDVQRLMLKVVNNHCAQKEALITGPRDEMRIRLTMPVLLIPVVNNAPVVQELFSTVTKECSTNGLSLVLDGPRPLDEVIVGFRWESNMEFIRAKAVHCTPIGAGFFQLGLQVLELVPAGDYPALMRLHI